MPSLNGSDLSTKLLLDGMDSMNGYSLMNIFKATGVVKVEKNYGKNGYHLKTHDICMTLYFKMYEIKNVQV